MNPALTPEIQAELRAQLEGKRDQLRATIASLRGAEGEDDTPDTNDSTDPPGDRGDASVELEEWDENHQEELDLQGQLAEVEHALGKFSSNTYGLCESCGAPIPLARLLALPEARYDTEHQSEREANP